MKIKLERHLQALMDQDGITRRQALEYIVDSNETYLTDEYKTFARNELSKEETWAKIDSNLNREGV